MTGVMGDYERQLWEELNVLLADAVRGEANSEDAGRTMLLAAMGHDPEVRELYEQVRSMARRRDGFLRERMEEDNPVSAIRRRLRLPTEAGQQA